MIQRQQPTLDEMIEDITEMLGTPAMYEHTLNTMVLNEDEKLIFQRAALHIKRNNPDKFLIKRAYEILVLKSFHNKDTNRYDTQNIKGNIKTEEKGVLAYIKNNLDKIIIFIIVMLILSKFI